MIFLKLNIIDERKSEILTEMSGTKIISFIFNLLQNNGVIQLCLAEDKI